MSSSICGSLPTQCLSHRWSRSRLHYCNLFPCLLPRIRHLLDNEHYSELHRGCHMCDRSCLPFWSISDLPSCWSGPCFLSLVFCVDNCLSLSLLFIIWSCTCCTGHSILIYDCITSLYLLLFLFIQRDYVLLFLARIIYKRCWVFDLVLSRQANVSSTFNIGISILC